MTSCAQMAARGTSAAPALAETSSTNTMRLADAASRGLTAGADLERLKPPARRAAAGANLGVQGLPMSFDEIETVFRTTGPAPALPISDSQSLAANRAFAHQQSWPLRTSRAGQFAVEDVDILDTVATMQESLVDLESSVAAVDSTTAEIATAVDSLTEDIAMLKGTVGQESADVKERLDMLTAQVDSMHSILAEVRELWQRSGT